jgi:hypothetical protein
MFILTLSAASGFLTAFKTLFTVEVGHVLKGPGNYTSHVNSCLHFEKLKLIRFLMIKSISFLHGADSQLSAPGHILSDSVEA